MREKKLECARGFTLIELLMVLALMGILAGLLIGAYQGIRQRMRKRLAVGDLERLASACEMYASFHGSLPVPDEDDTENFEIYEQLQYMGGGGDVRRRTKPLAWHKERLNGNSSMIDPWGKPYRFRIFEREAAGEVQTRTIYFDQEGTPQSTWNQLTIGAEQEFLLGPGAASLSLKVTATRPSSIWDVVVADAIKFEEVEGEENVYLFSPDGANTLKPTFQGTWWAKDGSWDQTSGEPEADGAGQSRCMNRDNSTNSVATYAPPVTKKAYYKIFLWYNNPWPAQKTPDTPIELTDWLTAGNLSVYRIYSCGQNGVDDEGGGDDVIRDVISE